MYEKWPQQSLQHVSIFLPGRPQAQHVSIYNSIRKDTKYDMLRISYYTWLGNKHWWTEQRIPNVEFC